MSRTAPLAVLLTSAVTLAACGGAGSATAPTASAQRLSPASI